MAQVKLPKAVQAKADRIEAMKAQAEEQRKTAEAQKTEPVKDIMASEPEPAAPEAPKPPENQQAEQQGQAPDPQPAEDPFKHKYEVLQRKYDVEVPLLHKQLREANDAIGQLRARYDTLEQQQQQQKQEAQKPSVNFDELEAEYPPEIVAVMRQQQQTIDVLQNSLRDLEGSMQSVQTEAHEDKSAAFWRAIDEAHPDWQQINMRNDFLAWLKTKELRSGKTYQQVVNEAEQRLYAQGLISVLDDWKATRRPQPETPVPSVEPTQGGSDGGGEIPQGRIYTIAEIKNFSDNLVKGRYKNHDPKDLEARRLDILAAEREGRVRR